MIAHASAFLTRNHAIAVCVGLGALVLLAWMNRFLQDDAFISFRYAQNLADGAGLIWNPGERVEGYTNFLWTVLMAIPFRTGIEPGLFSQALGLALYPGTLLLAYFVAHRSTGSRLAAVLAMLLLGTNYTFSSYATGGLETELHVLLLMAITALVVAAPTGTSPAPLRACAISLLAAAALLTRMDSAIYLFLLYGFLALGLLQSKRSTGTRAIIVATLLAPGAVIILAWLAWKLAFYGDILPNTYYAKLIPLSESWRPGLRFIWVFLRSYWLVPAILFALFMAVPIAKQGNRKLALIALMGLVGSLYAVRIGGDFMEFRFFVPALPFLFIPLAWTLTSISARPVLSLAVVVCVLAGSASHAYRFVWDHGIESIERLEGHLYDPTEAWVRTGEVLGELFDDPTKPVLIAVTAAGAVPFYSGLPTIDMHGVTDPWVARHGTRTDPNKTNPGHHRRATFDYLVDRGVNLVVGRPWIDEQQPGPRPPFGRHGLARFAVHDVPYEDELPADAAMRVLEIDLDSYHRLYVLYLMRSEEVDAVVREHGIQSHAVIPRRRAP